MFSQNVNFAHEKLFSLPIGLQNSQWGPENTQILNSISKDIEKTDLLYVNFSYNTHSSRIEIINLLSQINNTTIESGLPYFTYLSNLSKHKFCLCPRGNGIDTHRFWECQYLDVIPIIIKDDWTKSYSELPILILNKWEDILHINFNEEYHKIKLKNYNFNRLKMSYYKKIISNLV